ncbi:hypothetical protein HYQ46_007486 [Verticillium longisporum]|nr:hypothetical protein HYQ46_007486 [Verticillium longisporum]
MAPKGKRHGTCGNPVHRGNEPWTPEQRPAADPFAPHHHPLGSSRPAIIKDLAVPLPSLPHDHSSHQHSSAFQHRPSSPLSFPIAFLPFFLVYPKKT